MTLKLFFLAIVVSYDQDITGLVPSIIFLYNNNNNNNNVCLCIPTILSLCIFCERDIVLDGQY